MVCIAWWRLCDHECLHCAAAGLPCDVQRKPNFPPPFSQFTFSCDVPMIIFDLACQLEHPFEGWFDSQAAYDGQLADGLISCPYCGSHEVRRVPSAVHLAKAPTAVAADSERRLAAGMGVFAAYQQLMAAIVSNCEDVGSGFADEARKIHYMEAPQRAIRGQTSAEDYENLREEGIDVLCLPTVKKEILN